MSDGTIGAPPIPELRRASRVQARTAGGWKDMKDIKIMMMVAVCMGLLPLAFAQEAAPLRITASEAKNHVGQNATVCGKVVDTKVSKYGLAGHGKPVSFDLDQPEPNPVFFFIAFGTAPDGPSEVIAAYNEKRVCVAGKITVAPAGGPPFILAPDRSQVKLEAAAPAKPEPDAK
jgi:hypothetical protein